MRMNLKAALTASALVGMGLLGACADSATAPVSSSKFVTEVNRHATLDVGDATNSTPEATLIKICKLGDVGGTFTITDTDNGSGGSGNPTIVDEDAVTPGNQLTLAPGECVVAAEDNGNANLSIGDWFNVTEALAPGVTTVRTCDEGNGPGACPGESPVANGEFFINTAHGWVITYTNTAPPPPAAICDFITFGRLVTEVGGKKVVISGNAGGNNMDASIKNEFHIEYLGVDYHVADAITYGPIDVGPLSDETLYPNARVVTGIAKNGVAVELRVWDGGEPGKDTDKVWFKLGPPVNATIGGANGQFIDQGNMQYHSNCRGPDPK